MNLSRSAEQGALGDSIQAALAHLPQSPDGERDLASELESVARSIGVLDQDFTAAALIDRVLAVEALAKSIATFDHPARVLLSELIGRPGPTAVRVGPDGDTPVRFGASAINLLAIDGDLAGVYTISAPTHTTTESYGYPVGRTGPASLSAIVDTGRARLLWRLGVIAELCGSVDAAVEMTVRYVTARQQFGKPLGSIQTIQQGLAKVLIDLEGTRYLLYAAACSEDPGLARLGAERAIDTGSSALFTLQQCTGAVGLTQAHALHVFTMRAHALCSELRALRTPRVPPRRPDRATAPAGLAQ